MYLEQIMKDMKTLAGNIGKCFEMLELMNLEDVNKKKRKKRISYFQYKGDYNLICTELYEIEKEFRDLEIEYDANKFILIYWNLKELHNKIRFEFLNFRNRRVNKWIV
ncbi:hypothetical protein AN639_05770 [Candidatus Epulonipiscium fishelsonii]|nr:hypothetical protein AN639_05770 [Epulopiscium sp. SCG-B05WGA-EpuloA1]